MGELKEYYQPVMLNQKGIILNPVIVWIVIILGSVIITQDAVKQGYIKIDLSDNGSLVQKVEVTSTPSPSENPTPDPTYIPTSIPEKVQPLYVDPDPITTCNNPNCGPIKIPKSQCSDTVGYVCCQIGNKWTWYASRDQCTKDQNVTNQQINTYPPCTVYYPSLGYSKTYNYTSPSDCSYWQQRAKTSSQPLSFPEIKAAPLPTVEPYKPSQEYTDTYQKNMQDINKPWQPTQFVAPTPKCYATWDDYFKAHPYAGNAPIYGNVNASGTPPCD